MGYAEGVHQSYSNEAVNKRQVTHHSSVALAFFKLIHSIM